ncbi:hypothetical protein JZ751_024162 [Albula glossodonta]|uniref:Uncharacterized protein n=1 Tax=Albula glossodonta TaxID=121402 RepID=A0A8T2NJJ7_9TELE|nr:hypothetical protein JZ751_024162 [Albula glossodonta]
MDINSVKVDGPLTSVSTSLILTSPILSLGRCGQRHPVLAVQNCIMDRRENPLWGHCTAKEI